MQMVGRQRSGDPALDLSHAAKMRQPLGSVPALALLHSLRHPNWFYNPKVRNSGHSFTVFVLVT